MILYTVILEHLSNKEGSLYGVFDTFDKAESFIKNSLFEIDSDAPYLFSIERRMLNDTNVFNVEHRAVRDLLGNPINCPEASDGNYSLYFGGLDKDGKQLYLTMKQRIEFCERNRGY